MSAKIVCLAYGKINLYLEVIKKRRDGYHNLETLFQSVSLADRLEFERVSSGIALEVADAPPTVPSDQKNLVVKAAQLLSRLYQPPFGAHIFLKKNIPVAAGMAGGSADAAATLTALNKLWDLGLPMVTLEKIALQVGSDVPYCLSGGAKAARLRGEDLQPVRAPAGVWYVLVHPALEIRTGDIFTSPLLTCSSQKPFAGWTCAFRKARHAFETGNFAAAVFNRLEEVVFAQYSQLRDIKMRLLRAGCLAGGMSGSGPTMFGVCTTKDDAQAVRQAFPDMRVSVVCSTRVGVNILDGCESV